LLKKLLRLHCIKSYQMVSHLTLLHIILWALLLPRHLSARVKQTWAWAPKPPEGYEILHQISQGTNKVYLARNLQADKHVALKYVHPKTEAIEEERRGCTFQQKLSALGNQQVRIVECYGWKGNWIIYGLAGGQQLAKTPQASRCKSVIVNRLLEGVRLFASIGIMHRDLRPENIMVNNWDQHCEEIQVTFLDFGSAIGGLSQSILSEDLDDRFAKARRTLPYAWTPPEARTSKLLAHFKPYKCLVDLRSFGSYDVWGVGSIAFWLSHSSSSSCVSDKCLSLDAYTCTSGLAHDIADSASCSHARSSIKDLLAEEDSITKSMLTVEPCCRPTAEALLDGRVRDNQQHMAALMEACSQQHMAARGSAKTMLENNTEREAAQASIDEWKAELLARQKLKQRAAGIHVLPKGSVQAPKVAPPLALSQSDVPVRPMLLERLEKIVEE